MQKINLHTHAIADLKNIQIRNIFAQDFPENPPEYSFSIGLHPWHIENTDLTECYRNIELASSLKNMLAVGECGLDRAITTDFALQERCFSEQVNIANKYNKPLIIHNVRASADLLHIKKNSKSAIPWILHGYSGNLDTTIQLIRHGFYFSVGETLLRNNSRRNSLQIIPANRLFLETDDHEISIENIYLLAAQILETDEEWLVESIFNNFKTLFGDDKLVRKN